MLTFRTSLLLDKKSKKLETRKDKLEKRNKRQELRADDS